MDRLQKRGAYWCFAVLVGCGAQPLFAQDPPFIRGDSNASGRVDLSDAVNTLGALFLGTPPVLPCKDAADANDDGAVNIADPIYTLAFLFLGGPGLPAPGAACGADPTADALGCASFPRCAEGPDAPEVTVTSSDNQALEGIVRFGAPRMWKVEAGGQSFVQVQVPGIDLGGGDPGKPGVPIHRMLVAVPRGAAASIEAKAAEGSREKLLLYPFQPEAADAIAPPFKPPPASTFADKPFAFDRDAYSMNALFPANVGSVKILGQARDLVVAQVDIAAGQYNPAARDYRAFEAVELKVSFKGGTGAFLTEASLSLFEPPAASYFGAVLNRSDVTRFVVPDIFKRICFGEELLILTHPDLRDAANRLADWKRQKGISTSVFNVSDGAGAGPDTNEEIDAFIERRFDECLLRPSYVLLFGDSELVPTFYVDTQNIDIVETATIGSDEPYAVYDQGPDDDVLIDFAVGRIPVDTLEQADVVVDKTIAYERDPPGDADFYKNITIASQFQCCRTDVADDGRDQRTFAEVSELVRPELEDQGYTVQRIYTETVAAAYDGDPTPQKFFDGTALPAAIGAGSGFAWAGDGQDIIDAFNAGRFLILHRDHGWPGGWVNPGFTTADVVNDLMNGELLPVVFSVNCASGLFDNETNGGAAGTREDGVYFCEQILRKADGGAVGVLGDTRNSPSRPNSSLTKGYFDAVWPDTVPGFGDAVSLRRLGDILVHGKLHLLNDMGVTANTTDELNLWHAFGDPTLELWTRRPILLPKTAVISIEADRLRVLYSREGAVITAYESTVLGLSVLGRGITHDGVAVVPLLRMFNPEAGLLIVAALEGFVPAVLGGGSAPDDLASEAAFSGRATHIIFETSEGVSPGEVVGTQYRGVAFKNDRLRTPTAVDVREAKLATRSGVQALANAPDPGQTSARVPLVMTFDPPARRAGMYVGNGDGLKMRAVLTAFDATGTAIFSVSRTGFGGDVLTFIGLDVHIASIARAELDYGASTRSELIDDLYFE